MGKKLPNHSSLTLLLALLEEPEGLTVKELIKKQKIKRPPTIYQLVEKLDLNGLVFIKSMDGNNEGRPLRRYGLTARGQICAARYKDLIEAFEKKQSG